MSEQAKQSYAIVRKDELGCAKGSAVKSRRGDAICRRSAMTRMSATLTNLRSVVSTKIVSETER